MGLQRQSTVLQQIEEKKDKNAAPQLKSRKAVAKKQFAIGIVAKIKSKDKHVPTNEEEEEL